MKTDPETGKLVPDVRTQGGFATKTEALEYVPTLKTGPPADKTRRGKGVATPQPRPITTLYTLWEHYSNGAMRKLSKGKQSHYGTAWRKMEEIAYQPIADLDINTLQDLVDDKAPTYYPARDMRDLLSHLYSRAVAQGDVKANLAPYIDLPELDEGEQKPFTSEELLKIWKDYGHGHKISGYILLMAYSGMMPGELRRCDKVMIDWERKQIWGCGLKTKKRKETPIVIANIILPVLRDLCNYSHTDRLYPNWYATFYAEFHAALARCGIEDRNPYACRHTTATALAEAQVPEEIIKEVMRHTSGKTTQRYIHKEIDTSPMLAAVNTLPQK